MPKTKTKSHDLPKHAPKRTGKRGIAPRDVSGDARQEDEQELLKTPENAKKQPKQARLKGMEDPKIAELEVAAEEYADVRDRRMELTKEEVSTQGELLRLMKKHGKTTYHHEGYDLKIVAEKEKVRVRIHKDKD
jgi:hypothetical protein